VKNEARQKLSKDLFTGISSSWLWLRPATLWSERCLCENARLSLVNERQPSQFGADWEVFYRALARLFSGLRPAELGSQMPAERDSEANAMNQVEAVASSGRDKVGRQQMGWQFRVVNKQESDQKTGLWEITPDKRATGVCQTGCKGTGGERCWKYGWVLEFDIKGLCDNIDHKLLLRAVRKHITCKWALLYIERWLKAPMVQEDGTTVERYVQTFV